MAVPDQPNDPSPSTSNTADEQGAMSVAINQAIQMLQHEQQHGLGLPTQGEDNNRGLECSGDGAGIDNANEYSNSDELSMTQEFTMSPRRAETNTLSQVDFDQWMRVHAALEDNNDMTDYEYDNPDQSYDEDGDDDDEEREQEPVDVRSAWLKATQDWSSDENQSMDVDGDNPISIASSDDGEPDERELDYGDRAHEYVGQADLADNDSRPFITSAELFLAGLAEQALTAGTTVPTSATLEHLGQENANLAAEHYNEQYRETQTTLPQSLPSLDEMSRTINESLDRSNALANDIYTIFDQAAASSLNPNDTDPGNGYGQTEKADTHETGTSTLVDGKDLVERAEVAAEIERIRAEASAQQDKLNAQLVKLSTELFQMGAENNGLYKRIGFLERANCEYQQSVEQLEADVAEFKNSISAKDEELKTTTTALSTAEFERNDLASKCASLESQIERVVKKQPMAVQEASTSEQDHDQTYDELKDQLLKAQSKGRLLLGTNRALEARLGDALRELAEPVEPMDILADHRRHWDVQLVEVRSEMAAAKESLACAEQNLESEKTKSERLRIRVLELESIADPANATPRKRKADYHSDTETVAPPSAVGSMSQETVVTMSETPHAYSGVRIECQQAVVNAGEIAQNRRRKTQRQSDADNANDAGAITPTTPRTAANRRLSSTRTPYRPLTNKPVTPRIHLNRVPANIRSVSEKLSGGRLESSNDAFDMKENVLSRPGNNLIRRGNRTLEYRML
ncbi:hypothetical protein LPJ59_000475 [Coemansia sp. RSA 2399]|nr:hypothetical protein LPJ59_000475 [Coemansia sp. RSA 2399]